MTASHSPNGTDPLEALTEAIEPLSQRPDALPEALRLASESFEVLTREVLEALATALHAPLSDVYIAAVRDFRLTRRPPGEHVCVVCTGKHCQGNGSAVFIASLADEFDIETGTTSPDGLFSLVRARCLDVCGPSPAVILDGEVYDRETPDSIRELAREVTTR